jgi:hypothetical protein
MIDLHSSHPIPSQPNPTTKQQHLHQYTIHFWQQNRWEHHNTTTRLRSHQENTWFNRNT